ncbi:MAG: hypothetical protein ABIE74_06450 [Pseudomonadota bacterium]
MSITKVNNYTKAVPNSDVPPDPKAQGSAQDDRIKTDQKRIEDVLDRLSKLKKDSNISEEDYQEIEKLECLLKAQDAALESFDALHDKWGQAAADAAKDAEKKLTDDAATLTEGFTQAPYEDKTGEDQKKVKDSKYMGTFVIPAGGELGFKAGEESGVYKVTAKNDGRDIILTVYKRDKDGKETKESYVIKDGAVRTADITLIVLSKVEIDLTDAMRISNGTDSPAGTRGGFRVYTGKNDDIVRGSQGNDIIVTNAGDDIVYGNAGDDFIGTGSGDDKVWGGVGHDTINMGTMGTMGDEAHIDKDEQAFNAERIFYDTNAPKTLPGKDKVFGKNEGWNVTENKDGSGYTVTKDPADKSNNIEMNMPAGYKMAFAEYDADTRSLIVHLIDKDGKEIIVKFEGYFKGSMTPGTFTFKGNQEDNIIDFSRVIRESDMSSPVFNIKGGSGDDIIYAPPPPIDLSRSDLESSSAKESDINAVGIAEGKYPLKDKDGNILDAPYETKVGSDGKVRVSKGKGEDKNKQLYIKVPEGFTGKVYYYTDPKTKELNIVFVCKDSKGEVSTIVVVVDNSTKINDINDIHFGFEDGLNLDYKEEAIAAIAIHDPETLFNSKNVYDGEDGSDTFIGNKNFYKGDAKDTVIDIDYGKKK